MGEKGNMIWKVATLVCAALLAGTLVAVIVLATSAGDESDSKALEEQVQTLEDKVSDLEAELAQAEDMLAEKSEDESSESTAVTKTVSDYDQLEALGKAMAGEDFEVGAIVIDGDWARVGIAPKDPTTQQGELCYYHKINGTWTFVDCGTGLQYGDIPGAPASIFP